MELTNAQLSQLEQLAQHTGVSLENALEHALSEYRGILGLLPPDEPSPALDDSPAITPVVVAAPLTDALASSTAKTA